MHLHHDTKLNTALALLRLGGECFGQHNLLSTASEAERRAALERFFRWWNERTVPFLADVDKQSSLPFKIHPGFRAWAAIPRRAFSPEVDYGVNWGLLSPRDWPRWRTSLLSPRERSTPSILMAWIALRYSAEWNPHARPPKKP